MNTVKMICPKCSKEFEVNSALEKVMCPDCGEAIILNKTNNLDKKYKDELNKEKKKHKIKIIPIIIAILVAAWFINIYRKGVIPSSKTISSTEIFFGDWLSDNFEIESDAEVNIKDNTATIKFKADCIKSPIKEVEEMFSSNGIDINEFTLDNTALILNRIHLSGHNSSNAEYIKNMKTAESILNLKEGENEITIDFEFSDIYRSDMKELEDLVIELECQYKPIDKDNSKYEVIVIPWSVIEKEVEEEATQESEEVSEEIVVEEETIEETQEEEVIEESTEVTPEFKEEMDSYEQFFDEYIEFMESVKSDPALMTSAKYINLLSEYYNMMQKLEGLEDRELSDADYLYYAEVNLRIQEKLMKADIY